jgi:hypothetical protein
MSEHDMSEGRRVGFEAIGEAVLESLGSGMPPDQLKRRWRETCDYIAACHGVDAETTEEAYGAVCRMIDAASGCTSRPTLRLAQDKP